LGAGALVGGRGLLGDGVDAPVNVGVVLAVVVLERVEHTGRLLRRGGAVQVHQGSPIDQSPKDGEVVADSLRATHWSSSLRSVSRMLQWGTHFKSCFKS